MPPPRPLTREAIRLPAPAAGQGGGEGRSTTWAGALLDDKDIDAAWQVATETGAADHQWLTLADASRPTCPADALTAYLSLAEPLTHQTGNAVYERLVSLLLNMRDCHRRLSSPDEFTAYVTALRTTHRRKRNLMRLMDEHGL